jgi:hypothetical protein
MTSLSNHQEPEEEQMLVQKQLQKQKLNSAKILI